MTKQFLYCALAAFLLSACSTDLTEAGSKVRLLNSAVEASKCQLIKPIFASTRGGAESSTKLAMNETADAGANALYIVSTTHETNHTDVVGNALMCK